MRQGIDEQSTLARYFHMRPAILLLLLLLTSCRETPPAVSTPLPQRAYVWQREWTPAVSAATHEASNLDGLIVLGAEVAWKNGQPHIIRPAVDWAALRATKKTIGIALRIDPFSGPFSSDDERLRLFVKLAHSLLDERKENSVPCPEFQVDFDCAQKKLAGYRLWLRELRGAVKPARLVITTLPSWLDEPEFRTLINEVDAYVLQVHSVPTQNEAGRVALCDVAQAQRRVAKAAKLGKPFIVSLPTYSAVVGYDANGHLLGMALDGVQPSWPAGTRVVEFTSDADELSRLIHGWQNQRPAAMEGLVWYRLPVSTDARNWRWPTFAAVIEGRAPTRKLKVLTAGENPADLSFSNEGEAEEPLRDTVLVRWDGPAPLAAEALPGWTVTMTGNDARFAPASVAGPRLMPGAKRGIGWLRFEQRAFLHVEIIR